MKRLRIFISRQQPWKFPETLNAAKHISFTYRSCIKFEVIEGLSVPECAWVFFSSPNGVRLFFEHYALPKITKVAALGPGTAAALHRHQKDVAFSPSHHEVGRAVAEFAERLPPNAQVLYPRSTESLQRLSVAIPPSQLVDWPFYHTLPHPPSKRVPHDYLVFTSPSNARAYLGAHGLDTHQRIVAIGESTAHAIDSMGFQHFLTSSTPTPEGIWQVIKSDAGLSV